MTGQGDNPALFSKTLNSRNHENRKDKIFRPDKRLRLYPGRLYWHWLLLPFFQASKLWRSHGSRRSCSIWWRQKQNGRLCHKRPENMKQKPYYILGSVEDIKSEQSLLWLVKSVNNPRYNADLQRWTRKTDRWKIILDSSTVWDRKVFRIENWRLSWKSPCLMLYLKLKGKGGTTPSSTFNRRPHLLGCRQGQYKGWNKKVI